MIKRVLEYYTQLFKTLRDPAKLKKGYIFTGSEDYLMDLAVDTICNTIQAEKVMIDASSREFDTSMGIHIQGGLFQKRKLLVIKFVDKEKKVNEFLPLLLKTGEYFVFFCENFNTSSLPDGVEKVLFPKLDYESLKRWINDKLLKMGKKCETTALLDRLAFQIPQSLRFASNELKKLELYTMGKSFLKTEDLKVLSEYEKGSLREVISDILSGNSTYFKKLQVTMREIQSPVYVTSTFINIFMDSLKEAPKTGSKNVRSSSGYGGNLLKDNFSRTDILRMLALAVKFDSLLKSMTVEKDVILYEMALNFKINAGIN
ncbi:MAG: hypothetical protein ABIM32_02100 [candidate division WOR-3 bacterium]